MEFLWVRWSGKDANWNAGPDSLRLDRVGYVPSSDADAFGFLDPKLVLRACHLIPSFHWGKTLRLLGPSIAHDSNKGDWTTYHYNTVVYNMVHRMDTVYIYYMVPVNSVNT